MNFDVIFKGVRFFSGNLDAVTGFLAKQWGASETASELGVKLVPVPVRGSCRR